MNELEERINGILSSPEEMQGILRLAQSLMGDVQAPPEAAAQGLPEKLRSLLGQEKASASEGPSLPPGGEKGKGDKLALLEAIGPFLGEKRRRKMRRALQLARVAKLAGRFLEQEGGEGDH